MPVFHLFLGSRAVGNSMFDWPEQSHTSPTRMLLITTESSLPLMVRVWPVAAAGVSMSTRQRPLRSAVVR